MKKLVLFSMVLALSASLWAEKVPVVQAIEGENISRYATSKIRVVINNDGESPSFSIQTTSDDLNVQNDVTRLTFGDHAYSVGMKNSSFCYTFYADEAVKIPSHTAAYTGVLSGNDLVIEKTNSQIIPANTGVLVKSEEEGEHIFFVTDEYTSVGSNDLRGVSLETPLLELPEAGSTILILGLVAQNTQGFCLPQAGRTVIGANKAYLPISNANAPSRINIVMAPEIATAVEDMTSEHANKIMINGHLYIQNGENVYNAVGQLVKIGQ